MRDYCVPFFISFNAFMIIYEFYRLLIVIYDAYRTLFVPSFHIREIFWLSRDIWHVLCQLILSPYRPVNGTNYFSLGLHKLSNSNRTPNSFCVSTSNEACPHSSARCWGRHVLTVASQAGRKREWKIDRQSNTFSHVTKCVFNLPWSGVKKEKENAKRFCPFANDNDDDWNMRNMRPHTRIHQHTPTVGPRHVYLPRPSICCWILIAHRVAR